MTITYGRVRCTRRKFNSVCGFYGSQIHFYIIFCLSILFVFLTGFLACRDFICYAFVILISRTGCWVLPLLLNKNYVIYLKLMRLSDKYRLTR